MPFRIEQGDYEGIDVGFAEGARQWMEGRIKLEIKGAAMVAACIKKIKEPEEGFDDYQKHFP